MKRSITTAICGTLIIGFASFALSARAQSGSVHALSLNVTGTATNASVRPGGCPTLVCTTNIVTIHRCYTNCYPKEICTTNAAGQRQCTNVMVCNVHCYTNTFPKITCTNEFLSTNTAVVSEVINGGISADGCDELGAILPTNAVFHASLLETLRTNDWRGAHEGGFKITAGTNLVAFGRLRGVSGSGSHRGLEACGICNHLEGSLLGQIVVGGSLHGASIRATYSGNFVNAGCPAGAAPDGALSLGIEGVVVVPCPGVFEDDDDD